MAALHQHDDGVCPDCWNAALDAVTERMGQVPLRKGAVETHLALLRMDGE